MWLRVPCMALGALTMINASTAVVQAQGGSQTFHIMGVFVGAVWFGFGAYGGLPLVGTVRPWTPPTDSKAMTDSYRAGLRTMRRRKWAMWASQPIFVLSVVLLTQYFGHDHMDTISFLTVIPVFASFFVYWLSRCPRCGYGFFALSKTRASLLKGTENCRHCGLHLNADKMQA
jgi:hypothetical protein